MYLAGPGIEAGRELPPQPLLNTAPTILAALGLPASVEMKGVPVGWPEAGPRVDDYDTLILGLTWIGGSKGVNEDRVKELGYIEDAKTPTWEAAGK